MVRRRVAQLSAEQPFQEATTRSCRRDPVNIQPDGYAEAWSVGCSAVNPLNDGRDPCAFIHPSPNPASMLGLEVAELHAATTNNRNRVRIVPASCLPQQLDRLTDAAKLDLGLPRTAFGVAQAVADDVQGSIAVRHASWLPSIGQPCNRLVADTFAISTFPVSGELSFRMGGLLDCRGKDGAFSPDRKLVPGLGRAKLPLADVVGVGSLLL